ncbi:hypothetical protein [Methylorubrum sp. SB2]|uniref:hypothetical protein n=1 Tax=Methylorubrum subtropicum TaxID=3138812 RepID=UPI00313CF701
MSFCRPTTKPEAAGYDNTTILGAPPLCDLSDSNGRYSKEYTEVRDKGDARSTHRTLDETIIGLFWAYDGAWRIGTPPRLYNQCVRAVVEAHDEKSEKKFGEAALARLFALINVGMADAGIVAWQAKYAHDLWRPVIGIRQEDEGFGPGKHEGKAVVNGDPF